jgi:hypothetical protein
MNDAESYSFWYSHPLVPQLQCTNNDTILPRAIYLILHDYVDSVTVQLI